MAGDKVSRGKGEIYDMEETKAKRLIQKGFAEPVREQRETATAQPYATREYPRHTGGGWYELPNGEKVQGKEEAERRMKAGD